MARMHGKARGKSKSRKPHNKEESSWVTFKPQEIEMMIVKLAKEGNMPSQIGMKLRDAYGIPDVRVILHKKITKVLEEKKLLKELPEDVLALIKKDVALYKHKAANKQDMTAKRGIELTESKIKRLVTYYKRTGKIDESWKYDPKKAGMYIE